MTSQARKKILDALDTQLTAIDGITMVDSAYRHTDEIPDDMYPAILLTERASTYPDSPTSLQFVRMVVEIELCTRNRTQINTYDITGVDQGTKTFTVAESVAALFFDATSFTISGSTGNDGTYTVNGDATGTTSIIVDQVIPDATVDGSISVERTPEDHSRDLHEAIIDRLNDDLTIGGRCRYFSFIGSEQPFYWRLQDVFLVYLRIMIEYRRDV